MVATAVTGAGNIAIAQKLAEIKGVAQEFLVGLRYLF